MMGPTSPRRGRRCCCSRRSCSPSPWRPRKPGTPATLKADEPAYYLGALSLAYDFDFRADERDFVRAYGDYPYAAVENLIVMSSDGWRTLYYGKPYIFSFFAAPFVYLFGTNGIVFFNMAMLLAMVWMGFALLSRWNGETLAALFAAGFFLLSNAYLYVLVAAPGSVQHVRGHGLPLLRAAARPQGGGRSRAGRRGARAAAGSPGALPPPAGWAPRPACGSRRRCSPPAPTTSRSSPPAACRWSFPCCAAGPGDLLGHYALAGLLCGVALGGHLGRAHRQAVGLPGGRTGGLLHGRSAPAADRARADRAGRQEGGAESAGWFWLLDAWPDTHLSELAESSKYFLVGRHTGLFVYQPFALLALALFAFSAARRSLLRWSILLSAGLVAFFFLEFINFNWHGGGGFVGNRYFVMAYPLLIFLVGRIRFAWLVPASTASPAWCSGPAGVAARAGGFLADPPGHVRGPAFQLFPFEHSLREIPGYEGKIEGEVYVTGLRDQVRAVGDGFWLQGGRSVEVWVQSVAPLREISLHLAGPLAGNPARASLGHGIGAARAGPGAAAPALASRGADPACR